MAISIIHASIDENGKASGGKLGDQTGKEVCVRSWYNKPWNVYIECTDVVLADKAATLFESIAKSNKCGYDQGNRLSLYNALVTCNGNISKMSKCETDCSAAICAIYKFLGVNVSASCTTRNIKCALLATGKFKAYTDSKHLTSDKYARRGGLYLKEGSHIVMARDNGSAVKETISSSTSATTSSTYSRTQFIKDVQAAINVTVDGIVGNKTLNVLPTVSKTKNNKHAVVKILQTYLNTIEYGCGSADGIFGEKTRTAVKTFQKDNKLTSDGIVGKNTWNKLLGYKG